MVVTLSSTNLRDHYIVQLSVMTIATQFYLIHQQSNWALNTIRLYSTNCIFFFFQAEDGIRDTDRSRGLGDVYKRQDYSGI